MQMIGHLMCLWWWAVDYAPTGVIAADAVEDLCEDIDWDGDNDEFMQALSKVGLLVDVDDLDVDEAPPMGWAIHDWDDYGGKATVQSRELAAERGRYGAHIRFHEKAEKPRHDCKWCQGDPAPGDSTTHPDSPPYRGTKSPPIAEKRREEERRGDQDQTHVAPREHVNDPFALVTEHADIAATANFETFWRIYPRHSQSQRPGGGAPKVKTREKWDDLTNAERIACMTAVVHYAEYINRPRTTTPAAHATTWLNQKRWADWQEPAGQPKPIVAPSKAEIRQNTNLADAEAALAYLRDNEHDFRREIGY